MKMLNAWTLELDEPEAAVSEILDQLDLKKNVLKNSVGFITCSYDFIETGMVKAICAALPFDVVGCTTLTNANNAEAGTMLLCLTVLTADDCRFSTAVTSSLQGDLEGAVREAAKKAKTDLGLDANMAPQLVLAFLTMFGIGGEIMLNALNTELNGAPIFGTVGCDQDTAEFSNTYIIRNGEVYRDCLAFLLVSGNVHPRFAVTSTSEQNLRKQHAVITSSQGCLLREVNNVSAQAYFESMGLMTGKGIEGLVSVPIMVDYNDGTQPVARAIYGLNDDGTAISGGIMPEGSTLNIGRMDVEDIILTAEKSVKDLLKTEGLCGIIMFPCLGRNMVLAMDPFAEIDIARKLIGDVVPWHLAYSGGECCPVYTADHLVVNRFHNFTFIGCAI